MNVLLCTLLLNEMEWLPRLHEQHRDWPGLVKWVFVEAADRVYAEANPGMVSEGGFSIDGTTELLLQLHRDDPRVTYVPHGISTHSDPAQGKCAARQRYLDVADDVKPDLVVVLDADEFYTHAVQAEVESIIAQAPEEMRGVVLRQRHVWRPPSIAEVSLFSYEAVGGYWNVPHCRFWRWSKKMRYKNNHNTPQAASGKPMTLLKYHEGGSECVHMGFASSVGRHGKHAYYERRGETKSHPMHVECRAAWECWQPGDELPHGAMVVPYGGQVPEVFR